MTLNLFVVICNLKTKVQSKRVKKKYIYDEFHFDFKLFSLFHVNIIIVAVVYDIIKCSMCNPFYLYRFKLWTKSYLIYFIINVQCIDLLSFSSRWFFNFCLIFFFWLDCQYEGSRIKLIYGITISISNQHVLFFRCFRCQDCHFHSYTYTTTYSLSYTLHTNTHTKQPNPHKQVKYI